MKWTTDKPTQPGWYWIKDGSAARIVELEIGTFDGVYVAWVWQVGSRAQIPLERFNCGEWAGPIPEPEEAADDEEA